MLDHQKRRDVDKSEIEQQLNTALEDTFPASDPISVADSGAETPDRPLHRKPAAIDKALVERLAREVTEKSGAGS